MANRKRPRIVIEKGHVVLEGRRVSVELFVHEHDDGGLYFEIAARNGASFRPAHLQRSLTAIVYPATGPDARGSDGR